MLIILQRRVRRMNVHRVPRLCHSGKFLRAAHSIIVYQRKAVDRRQPLTSLETIKLDDKRASDYVSAEFAHQRNSRVRGPAGREQVIGNQHPRSVYDPVLMRHYRVLEDLKRYDALLAISAATHEGLRQLVFALARKLEEKKKEDGERAAAGI